MVDKKEWIKRYYPFCESYTKMCLSDKDEIPVLKLSTDGNSYTDHVVIHIGIGNLPDETEDELLSSVMFLIGHEVQHVRSTTQRAWMYGMNRGYQTVLEEFAKKKVPKKGRFRNDKSYDEYLSELNSKGYKVSKASLQKFVHYVANSLEDGRIERIRCANRPGFKKYLVRFRGREWKLSELPQEMIDQLDDPRTYLAIVLNQVLSLSTTSLYQKGFTKVCNVDSKAHVLVASLMNEIAEGVASDRCKDCMEHAINICRILAVEIMEASKLSPMEEFLKDLFDQIVESIYDSVDSRTEEHSSESGEAPFGSSDLVLEVDDETYDKLKKDAKDEGEGKGMRIIIKRKNPEKEEDDGNDSSTKPDGKSDDKKSDGKDTSSPASKDSDDAKGEDASDGSEKKSDADADDSSNEASSSSVGESTDGEPSSGNPTSGSSDKGNPSDSSEDNAIDDAVSDAESDMSDEIDDFMRQAEDAMEEELDSAMEDAYKAEREEKKAKRKEEKNKKEDVLPDLSGLKDKYDYAVSFREVPVDYRTDARMPFELKGQANVLKRKIHKIFKNMEKPVLRGRRSGKIDPSDLYKAAINEMDFFVKKAQVPEFDGCAYFLADNSGSMGWGDRREECCKALAKIEHAFQDVMPLKITAFDAGGNTSVKHICLKNWSEKVTNNGSYNFLVKDYSGLGNKDGYSIRVATKELLARPEKKKILIVLSDGAPTEYPGGQTEGMADVNHAVKDARKNGIEVLSIFFGDPDEQDTFYKMYEKNCIVTDPSGIDQEIVRIMKRFTFR